MSWTDWIGLAVSALGVIGQFASWLVDSDEVKACIEKRRWIKWIPPTLLIVGIGVFSWRRRYIHKLSTWLTTHVTVNWPRLSYF